VRACVRECVSARVPGHAREKSEMVAEERYIRLDSTIERIARGSAPRSALLRSWPTLWRDIIPNAIEYLPRALARMGKRAQLGTHERLIVRWISSVMEL